MFRKTDVFARGACTLFTLLFAWPSFADIPAPARKIEDVSTRATAESVVNVTTARIVMADYDLIKKDFPELAAKTDAQIDRWLIEQCGHLAQPQADQEVVNTKVAAGGEKRTAFRPPDYGRALVFRVPGGLIDGKGFGALAPLKGGHSNGLASLGEMIREFLYQKLVQKIFEHSGSGYETVASYAVIDWGFKIRHKDDSLSPAGAILRQAHARATGIASSLDETHTREVERVLRHYGITSAGAYRNQRIERLNIQGTPHNEVIDFGGFLAVEKFSKQADMFELTSVVFDPQNGEFPQPDPAVRVPLEQWGYGETGKEDPKYDNPWIWSHRLADSFAEGHATRADVDQHFKNLMEPALAKLRRTGGACRLVAH